MLETKRLPCLRAASIRLTWPACRLPMVGTNTTRSWFSRQRPTCARTSAMVVAVSMRHRSGDVRRSRVELMLGRRVGFLFHGLNVFLQRIQVGARTVHEIIHEERLGGLGEVGNVVY